MSAFGCTGKRAAAAQDEKGASAWDMPSDDDDWAAQGTGGKRSARKTPPSKGRMSKAGKVSAALAIALANTSHHGRSSLSISQPLHSHSSSKYCILSSLPLHRLNRVLPSALPSCVAIL